MNILGIQLLGILFSVALLYFVFIHRKKNEFNEFETAFWALIGLALLSASAFPTMLGFLVTDVLNISRTMDFLIIAACLTMLGIMLYLFILVKRTQSKMEKLVREIAVERADSILVEKRKNNHLKK